MRFSSFRSEFLLFLLSQALADGSSKSCKAIPDTPSWPSDAAWAALNKTLSGALIKSVPPGGVCHPEQPNFNSVSCLAVAQEWTTSWTFHGQDPVGNGYNNWNNDTCLPDPTVPCSDIGYPVYVINASTSAQVQAGVNFARQHNVRLNVKSSGHDFLGRSVSPYSLSIWTYYLRGLNFHKSFVPVGCLAKRNDATQWHGAALSRAAGENSGSAFAFADSHGMMMHVGGAPTVSPGGYVTGAGHSVISFQKGLAADAILQMDVVLPSGQLITASPCQNADLFWGIRGGGGATLGVVTNFTTKIWPSEPVSGVIIAFEDQTNRRDKFWDAMAYVASQLPRISREGAMCYTSVQPVQLLNASSPLQYQVIFVAPSKKLDDTLALINPLVKHINSNFAPEIEAISDGGQTVRLAYARLYVTNSF
jgi:hypothetical protein